MSVPLRANNEVVEIARDLIRIPSLTPVTQDLRPAARQSLDLLKGVVEASGARCEWLTFEGGHDRWPYPVDNLYAEWGAGEGPRLCFIGHVDVVPPGAAERWSRDPFSGAVEGGFLFGRGATDMKGAVAAFAAAAAEVAKAQAGAAPAIAMIVTADEEWAAINGTRRVLEWMRDRGNRPSAFLVGEPSSEEFFGASIKIGRRGSLCGTLSADGVQGHAAYPGLFENPNRALSLALAILHAQRWYDAEPGLPATNFETVATQSGDFGATAIIPGEARSLWNIRFTHHESVLTLASKLQQLLDNPPRWVKHHPDAGLLRKLRLAVNSDTAAMPYYSAPGAFAALARSIVAERTGLSPVFDARGGTTDARFVQNYFPGAEIIELGLPECGGLRRSLHPEAFGRVGGMHQAEECCSVQDLQSLTVCYRDLITAYQEQSAW